MSTYRIINRKDDVHLPGGLVQRPEREVDDGVRSAAVEEVQGLVSRGLV